VPPAALARQTTVESVESQDTHQRAHNEAYFVAPSPQKKQMHLAPVILLPESTTQVRGRTWTSRRADSMNMEEMMAPDAATLQAPTKMTSKSSYLRILNSKIA
jgi:hypothetical protein